MSFRRLRAGLAVAMVLVAGHASAQQLSHQQLVNTLGQVSQAGGALDLGLLYEEVSANLGKGAGALPNWARLENMPQLAVEVNFELGSVAMVPESYRTIGLIADALHDPRLINNRFLVVGHTDSTGDAAYNLKLSLQRAEVIGQALTTTFSVPADTVYVIGVGEELPVNAADPKAAANRRVQIINLGPAKVTRIPSR